MLNFLPPVFNWAKRRWQSAGMVWKTVLAVGGLTFLYFLVSLVPHVEWLKLLYGRANPETQLMFLMIGLVVLVGITIVAVDRWNSARQLESEKNEAQARQVAAEGKQAAAEAEAKRLQEQWDHLLSVGCKDELWRRAPGIIPPGFEPKLNRKTRFITVLNLKGGVGKTTLTANIAACLAEGIPSLRVLVIDIDFQGTLSRSTVEGSLIGVQVGNGSLVSALLTTPTATPGLVDRLAVPMYKVKANRIILADEVLDSAEFEVQARFFVERKSDPRFRFRLHLHDPKVLDQFDVVVFDCPPRVTASVVNAIACSDYILIPTKLDTGSVDAIPRTLAWVRSLGAIGQAEVLGILASHVTLRSGKPVSADLAAYEYLRRVVQSECGNAKLLFQSVVPLSSKAISKEGEIAGLTPEGRKLFDSVVNEMRERMEL
jgi:cellulose biosynthesis protein BcsQ